MIELQGKYNTAKIFTDVVDEASIAQVIELCNPGVYVRKPHPHDAGYSCGGGLHRGDNHDSIE